MGTRAVGDRHPLTETTQTTTRTAGRLLFVDNIRIFLTVLVILHHLMIIYAGSGSWIYTEGRQDEISAALGAWFCSINQAYFMGLFLLISAYFVPGSYDRKGPARFLKDRLIRLGIPLGLYSWVVRPLFIYLAIVRPEATDIFLRSWYRSEYFRDYGIIGGGPLWFISTLLIFSAVYVLWRLVSDSRRYRPQKQLVGQPPVGRPPVAGPFPSGWAIVLFGLGLAATTFLVRLRFPVNESFQPLNLQLANFAQYAALFVVGLLAYRHNWLLALPASRGKLWMGIAVSLVILYPVLAIATGAAEDSEPFMGGWTWQSLVFALFESFLAVSMCLGLIYFFRRFWDRQGQVAGILSRSAYGAYLVHEPVISLLAMAAAGLAWHPLLKFGLAAPVAVSFSFGLAILIRRLPHADRVL